MSEFIKCEKCNGTGAGEKLADIKKNGERTGDSIYINCSECNGEGKLDWVENIVGKRDLEGDDCCG